MPVVFPHHEARVRVGCRIPHSKDSLSLLMVQYSEETCVKKKVEVAKYVFNVVSIIQLRAVYTCDFPYESLYDSVYDMLPKVSSKLFFDFFG
jgi:hypothetical protein